MATSVAKDPTPAPAPTPAAPPQFRKIDGHSDVSFAEPAEDSPEDMNAVRAHVEGDADAHRDAERAQLLSRETSAAVDSAFNTLAQTVLVQNARTLEDLVREMLRPMLKTWLDDNLPGMVERLVRAEIERVSRGRAT
jgi:cell pole-organizing protein PopZ